MPSLARHCCIILTAVAVQATAAVAAKAQEPVEPAPRAAAAAQAQAQPVRQVAPQRSLSDAVRHVQRTTGGRILGAERVPYDGRDINRVKYMDDRGRVKYMDDPGPAQAAGESGASDARPRRANP